MTALTRHGVAHPVRTIGIAAILLLLIAPGLTRLHLRTDGHAMVPADDPAVRIDADIRAWFSARDVIVVLVRGSQPDGIFHPRALTIIRDLTEDLAAIDGVGADGVTSLATEKGDRHQPGTLDYRRFLDPVPDSAAAIAELRADLLALDIHIGTIVSDDGAGAAIHVAVPPGADRDALYAEIVALASAAETETVTIDVIGAPVAESRLGTHVLDDLGMPAALLGAGPPRWIDDAGGVRRRLAETIGMVPLAALIMAVIFIAAFRTTTAAIIPLLEVGACLIVVFALMGWLGIPVYLTTTILPVILTAVGIADEIHIVSRYAQRLRAAGTVDHAATVLATMRDVGPPIVKTSITTAAAFACFAASPIGAVRVFGIFAAVGIAVCLLWSLAVTPALLTLIPPARFSRSGNHGDGTARWLARLAAGAARRRALVIAIVLLAVVVAPFGVRHIAVQDSWIDGFAPSTRFSRATEWFNEHFFGAHVLLVSVETEPRTLTGTIAAAAIGDHHVTLPFRPDNPEQLAGSRIVLRRPADVVASRPRPDGATQDRFTSWIDSVEPTADGLIVHLPLPTGSPAFGMRPTPNERFEYTIDVARLETPATLRAVDGLERRIAQMTDLTVGGVLGPATYLKTTSFIVGDRDPETRAIPDGADRVRWLWSQYERIRGVSRTRQIIDEDHARGLVSVFMRNANYVDTARLLAAIRDYEREHLAPLDIRLAFGGDVIVSQTLILSIVKSQVRSLLLSLLVVLALATVLSRSLVAGVLCVLPCAAAVLVSFAVMGWAGIPLGVATSMFAGMVLGIGVDYAIHLLENHRNARLAGAGPEAAISDAMAVTGPAILVDALAVMLGFGVLTCSSVPANARLGLLAVVCTGTCLLTTLLLLPALLRIAYPARRRSSP